MEIEGREGKVQKISLRSTRAFTRNQRVMIIPNHMFMSDLLFNWTQNNTMVRDNVEVGIAYGSDTHLAEKLLLESTTGIEGILDEPKPNVLFDDFGDSSLHFVVNFYVNDAFAVQRIKSDLRFEIDKKFREHNISIPFPQRDLHIYQDKNLAFSIKEKQNNTEE